jgi:hypothetical protein
VTKWGQPETIMSEEPKSIWRRPWQGWAKIFGWWAILASAVFVVILCVGLASAKDNQTAELTLTALAVSVGIATLTTAGFWFMGWLCCWRNFRRLLVALAGFATLIAIFYAEENWRGKRAWKNYVRAQEARGEKMDLAAFIPPPIPDDQNLALCPLFKPVLDFRYATDQDRLENKSVHNIIWLDTNGSARLDQLDLHWNMRNNPNSPAGKVWREFQGRLDVLTNGWINLPLWQEYYRMGTNLDGATPASTPAQDVLYALRYFEPDLTELRREASLRPLARWPIQYDLNSPWGILLPHLAKAKRITMLLQVRAAARLAAGQTADGLEDIALGFRLADSFGYEPFLISQLVRMACYEIILQPLKEGQAHHQFSDAQLTLLQQQLQSVDLLAGYQLAVRCERSINGLWANMTRADMDSILQYSASQSPSKGFWRFAIRARVAPKGWIYQNQLVSSRLDDDYILSAVDAHTRTVSPKKSEAALSAKREAKGPYSALVQFLTMSESQLGDALPFACKFAYGQTQVDLARVACGLERYRLAHNQYPEALDALAPQFITKLPHDIINGQPLKYRRTDDGSFVLYSVGWNETDDGGIVASSPDPKGVNRREEGKPVNLTEGDWVWRYPAK